MISNMRCLRSNINIRDKMKMRYIDLIHEGSFMIIIGWAVGILYTVSMHCFVRGYTRSRAYISKYINVYIYASKQLYM